MTKTYVDYALNKVIKTYRADAYFKTKHPRMKLTYNEHKHVSDKTENFGRNYKK